MFARSLRIRPDVSDRMMCENAVRPPFWTGPRIEAVPRHPASAFRLIERQQPQVIVGLVRSRA